MSNEFEWRSQMRKLNTPVQPERDLWSDIVVRLEQQPTLPARRHSGGAWRRGFAAIAATLVVASGAGLFAYRLDRTNVPTIPVAADVSAHNDSGATQLTALDWAVPADPKLAVAAQGLDKASADLQAALEARPDAVFLVSMINRTNAQRMRLLRQSAISG
jgi:anti-sigma-K factor RskA